MKDVNANLQEKEISARKALEFIKDGQIVGLGTGSTTAIFIRLLGEKIRNENIRILACTSSYQSLLLAKEWQIPIYPVSYFSELDISVDGADEVDPRKNLIKGGGGAHTLEKIMHAMSREFLCIVDSSKLVKKLGEKFSVPVEVIPEGVSVVEKHLKKLGAEEVSLRIAVKKDGPVVTDNGNLIIDAKFTDFSPEELEIHINAIPGVIENGIFARFKPARVIAGENIIT